MGLGVGQVGASAVPAMAAVSSPWGLLLALALSPGLCSALPASQADMLGLAVRYFTTREVRLVTSVVCWDAGDLALSKAFSSHGIRHGVFRGEPSSVPLVTQAVYSPFYRTGVLVDLSCPASWPVLQVASEHRLFNSHVVWLVVLGGTVGRGAVVAAAAAFRPPPWDPLHYLTHDFDGPTTPFLLRVTEQLSADLMAELRAGNRTEEPEEPEDSEPVDETELGRLFRLEALLDCEVVLALPEPQPLDPLSGRHTVFELYEVYKLSTDTAVNVTWVGRAVRGGGSPNSSNSSNSTAVGLALRRGWLSVPTAQRRRDMHRTILRAVASLLYPKQFVSLEDHATWTIDVWVKISVALIRVVAEHLNIRLATKVLDKFGWNRGNNSYDGMLGFLQQHKAQVTGTGLMIRQDRLPAFDYVDSSFRLTTGVLFRQPALSSVANIFVLPFSSTVWWCLLGLVACVAAALCCHGALAGLDIEPSVSAVSYADILSLVLGAMCQQGISPSPSSLSARTIMLCLLIASVFLYTSYSATIVALLQSPGSSISSLSDLTSSTMELGVQDVVYDRMFFKEETVTHEVIRQLYTRKLKTKGEAAFMSHYEGVHRIRREMFAFQVDLPVAFQIISETWSEQEKCGLKHISLYTTPFIGVPLPKLSPYKEIFMVSLRWLDETGLVSQIRRKWIKAEPPCHGSRGFVTVGLIDFYPALLVVAGGALLSVLIFLLETLHYRLKQLRGQPRSLKSPAKPTFLN